MTYVYIYISIVHIHQNGTRFTSRCRVRCFRCTEERYPQFPPENEGEKPATFTRVLWMQWIAAERSGLSENSLSQHVSHFDDEVLLNNCTLDGTHWRGSFLDSSQIPDFRAPPHGFAIGSYRYSQTIEPWNFVTLACHEVRMSSRTCLPPSKPPKKKKPNSQIRRTCSSSSSAVFMHIHFLIFFTSNEDIILHTYIYICIWHVGHVLSMAWLHDIPMVIVLILCSYFYSQFKDIWRNNLKYFFYLHSGSIWASESGIERLRLKRKKDMMLANMSLGINLSNM